MMGTKSTTNKMKELSGKEEDDIAMVEAEQGPNAHTHDKKKKTFEEEKKEFLMLVDEHYQQEIKEVESLKNLKQFIVQALFVLLWYVSLLLVSCLVVIYSIVATFCIWGFQVPYKNLFFLLIKNTIYFLHHCFLVITNMILQNYNHIMSKVDWLIILTLKKL